MGVNSSLDVNLNLTLALVLIYFKFLLRFTHVYMNMLFKTEDKELLVIGAIIEAFCKKPNYLGVVHFEISSVNGLSANEAFNIILSFTKKYPWCMRSTVFSDFRGPVNSPDFIDLSIDDFDFIGEFGTVDILILDIDGLKSLKNVYVKESFRGEVKISKKTKVLGHPPLEIREDEHIYVKGDVDPTINKGPNRNYYFVRACIEKNNSNNTVNVFSIHDFLVEHNENYQFRNRLNPKSNDRQKISTIRATYHNCVRVFPVLKKYLKMEKTPFKTVEWLNVV